MLHISTSIWIFSRGIAMPWKYSDGTEQWRASFNDTICGDQVLLGKTTSGHQLLRLPGHLRFLKSQDTCGFGVSLSLSALAARAHCLISQLEWCSLSCAHWQHIPVPSLPGWQTTYIPTHPSLWARKEPCGNLESKRRRRRRGRRALISMVISELLLSLTADL